MISKTIIFLGISADDIAVGGFLEYLNKLGVDLGSHFWITTRADGQTDRWAEENNIQSIYYAASDEKHVELNELLSDLHSFQPVDSPFPPPVTMIGRESRLFIRDPQVLRHEPSLEELRKELNAYAASILKDSTQESYNRYDEFCEKYDEAIYHAWYIRTDPPNNLLFDYQIEEEIAEGAFGKVYRAKKPNGDLVAVKVLKEAVRSKREMLQSFRRGVRSMRILAERKINGMVPYEEASEIPAFCVMELINGPNLTEAVNNRYCKDWEAIIDIASQLSKIIRRAHRLPERILHRDIRPSNIMLKDYYLDPSQFKVVVLDFDLSWHMGAYELSVSQKSSMSGFLAPEQVIPMRGMSTRNAAVDSYGLGMTLYFLCCGKEPMYQQHRHTTWQHDLLDAAKTHPCPTWRSLPRRFARLIENATKHNQAERWDMAQIEGELDFLFEAINRPKKISSPELIAEELAQRFIGAGSYNAYVWDSDKLTATIELASGLVIKIIALEDTREVKIRIEWIGRGDRLYKNIKKYLVPALDQTVSRMQALGWRVLPETYISREMAGVSLTMKSRYLVDGIEGSATELASCARAFKF